MALKDFLNGTSRENESDLDGWVNINNSTWSPERPGDFIEGTLVEKKHNVGKWDHNLYVIRRSDGVSKDVWGCYRLDKKMDEILVDDYIRIIFKGEILKSDGNAMYDYDVLKKITKE